MEKQYAQKVQRKGWLDLQECWFKDEELKEYFRTNCQDGHEICLAVRLMKEAIACRKSQYKQAKLQSNFMTTVKRKDREVTAKVTQIQPVKSEKIRIFGKPRVKLDEGRFCVIHEDPTCQNCLNSTIKANKKEKKLPAEDSSIRIRTDYNQNRKQAQKQRTKQEQVRKDHIFFKKTTQKGVQVAEKRENIAQTEDLKEKTKQIGKIISKSQPKDKKSLEITKNSKRMSRNKTQENFTFNQTAIDDGQNLNSTSKMLPFGSKSEFIQNDLVRKIAEQNLKLQRLQKQQEEMMLRQFDSDRLFPTKIKKKSRQAAPFLAQSKCSCCSSDSQIMSKLTELGLSSNPNISKAVSSKFLKDRTYKISDNPIYPMSSSSSTSEFNQA